MAGRVASGIRNEYDHAGRLAATISNYVGGTPSGSTGDDDVYTRYTYDDGLQTELWLDVDGDGTQDSGTDQVTEYVYGVTPSDSPGASEIAANTLLRKVVYPFDSASETEADNRMLFAYNAQGEEIWVNDQIGYEMESSYDTGSRLTSRAFTNAGSVSGLDESVLRVEFGYTDRGQVETVVRTTRPPAARPPTGSSSPTTGGETRRRSIRTAIRPLHCPAETTILWGMRTRSRLRGVTRCAGAA